MFARATTIKAQLDRIEAGIAHMNDLVMPGLMGIDGCVGLSLLVDRDTGLCIATSAWATEDAMRASGGPVRSIRDRAAEAFGGGIEDIQEWDIGLLHREHMTAAGACARVSWMQCPPERMDDMLDYFRHDTLPALEALGGFSSASVFMHRVSGRSAIVSAWDSHEAMTASRDSANGLRRAIADQFGAMATDVHEFELAVSHLRVPEMA